MKKARYILEYLIALILVSFVKSLSVKTSSNICGFLGRRAGFFIGRVTGENKKALHNLSLTFPEKTLSENKVILKKTYENMARFIAEYINQSKMDEKYCRENIEVIGAEKFFEKSKNGCFAISAHFGNWEIGSRFLLKNGITVGAIYKPQGNPYLNSLYLKQRSIMQIPKESSSMKHLINMIKEKRTIAILIDQRDKQGDIYTFLGRQARTSVAIQRLSLKYNFPIVPIKCFRTKEDPNKFKVVFGNTIAIESSGDTEQDIKSLTEKSLQVIEEWIRAEPENWMLWAYSRWRTSF